MRPWFRVYREERGTFAQLPLVCRGIAMEILKLTDDEGVIRIGRKAPVEAIAFALGATRSDRRALAQYVPMLLEDGFLVHEGDRLVVPNFPRFQSDDRTPTAPRPSHDPTPKKPRPGHDATTTEPRPDREPTTTAQRTSHETEHKPAESFAGTDRALSEERREEKNRGEERENARAPSSLRLVAPTSDAPELPEATSTRAKLIRAFRPRWETAKNTVWPGPGGDPNFDRAVRWLEQQATRDGIAVEAAIERVLEHWFADSWVQGAGYPPGNLTNHIANYWQRRPVAKSPSRGGMRPPAPHSAFVEDTSELDRFFQTGGEA